MKSCILYSAGIDSFILREYLFYKGEEFDCLYFDYHGKYSEVEIDVIKKQKSGDKVKIIDTINLGKIEQPSAFIPNRNIMLSVMANSLGYDQIWIGGSLSDRVNDNNQNVMNELSRFLTTMNGRYIKIDSPFWEVYKTDMARWFVRNSRTITPEVDLITNTFSCYEPLKEKTAVSTWQDNVIKETYFSRECGYCPACFRKNVVILAATGRYINFTNEKIVDKYEQEFSRGLTANARSVSTMEYINARRYYYATRKG